MRLVAVEKRTCPPWPRQKTCVAVMIVGEKKGLVVEASSQKRFNKVQILISQSTDFISLRFANDFVKYTALKTQGGYLGTLRAVGVGETNCSQGINWGERKY